MGCDIHSYAEVRKNNKWEVVKNHFTLDEFDRGYYGKKKGDHPFDWRSYSMFGFLADVRNYSCCKPLSEPRGIPDDVSDEIMDKYRSWFGDAHSASYLTLKELADFDYDQTFWNRRVMKNGNGAALAEKGEGEIITYREHLSDFFFKHLEELKELGNPEDVRIVFWFDN